MERKDEKFKDNLMHNVPLATQWVKESAGQILRKIFAENWRTRS